MISVVLALLFGPALEAKSPDEHILVVSMVTLLVTPEAFAGKRIAVFGYSSGLNLHLTEDHALFHDPASQILIGDHTDGRIYEDCGERYVRMEGRWERYQNSYILTDFTRVWDARNGKYCWGVPPT